MSARARHRVTVVALLFFTLFFLPNLSPIAMAQSSRPVVVFAPSPSMPLPTPPAPGVVTKPAPISGVLRVLVLAVAFSDKNSTTSTSTLKAEFFGGVADYYKEVSYGSVTLAGDIYGWYKLPYPEAHYGRDCLAIDDADCSGSDASWQIAEDAVTLAKKDNVNFMNYDYFVFIHSGYGQESSGVKDDVWSVTYLGGVWVQTSSRTLTRFEIVPEVEASGAVPEGVYAHEFGHLLGLPDLYNTNNGRTIMGPWSLMDKGLWNGDPAGSSPSHMEAWSKIQLGFISGPMLATANSGVTSSFTVDPTEVASNNVHVVQIPLTGGLNPSQYYLVEVRAAIGFDSALPATGALITYVDNTLLVGRIRVIDGHPSVPGLEDATWNVGQTFSDTKNSLAVSVTGKVGNSYQITVNRGTGQPPPPPITNQTYVDMAITNINAQPQVITSPNTTVTITVQISNLGTKAATNVPVEIDLDGQSYANAQVSVSAGSSTQTSFTWVSVLGSHVFRVVVDPNNLTNDANRANNVATFSLSVGPTLTINVPVNVTSAGSIWVLINGVRYNLTAGQLQTSVPNGTATVQIQPAVNTSLGVRQLFTAWGDGNSANPRQVTVTSNTIIQATYATQFLLSINQNGGTVTPSGWYNANTVAAVYALDPSNVTANTSRLLFSSWSGDLSSNSTSLTVTMSKPVFLIANWIRQYYVTIISPTGSPTGGGWYNAGSIATVAVQSTVQFSNGTRKIFTGWNSTLLGQNPSGQIMVNAPTALQAGWKTQYLVSIQSQYGTPMGSGWYDAGSNVPVYIQTEVNYPNATRRIFGGWTGDYVGSSANMTVLANSPKTLTAKWNTEYLITFKVNGVPNSTILKLNLNNTYYDLSVNNYYQAWYQKGAAINPISNQTLVEGIMVHKFTGWRNATGGTVEMPWTVNGPQTYVASYSTELTLPPIPGFPIEGIILGILIGSLMLVAVRRRRLGKIAYDGPDDHFRLWRDEESKRFLPP